MAYDKKIIASNIAYLRISNKLTQLELAEKLNYSDKAVSKWERGDSIPDIFVLKQIADMFGVSLDFFFEEHKQEEEVAPVNVNDKKREHLIITLLSVAGLWLLATIAYIVVKIVNPGLPMMELLFIASVPVSFIILLVFNSIWGKKKFFIFIISGLLWSFLLTMAVAFSFVMDNMWLLLFIGIPGQIAALLGCGLGSKIIKRNKKQNKK